MKMGAKLLPVSNVPSKLLSILIAGTAPVFTPRKLLFPLLGTIKWLQWTSLLHPHLLLVYSGCCRKPS